MRISGSLEPGPGGQTSRHRSSLRYRACRPLVDVVDPRRVPVRVSHQCSTQHVRQTGAVRADAGDDLLVAPLVTAAHERDPRRRQDGKRPARSSRPEVRASPQEPAQAPRGPDLAVPPRVRACPWRGSPIFFLIRRFQVRVLAGVPIPPVRAGGRHPSSEIRPGRSDRGSSPCPRQPRSHAQTPPASCHMRRLPRSPGAGSSTRR